MCWISINNCVFLTQIGSFSIWRTVYKSCGLTAKTILILLNNYLVTTDWKLRNTLKRNRFLQHQLIAIYRLKCQLNFLRCIFVYENLLKLFGELCLRVYPTAFFWVEWIISFRYYYRKFNWVLRANQLFIERLHSLQQHCTSLQVKHMRKVRIN